MTELARLYAEIALLRKKPQDVPASAMLLVFTALAYAVINIIFGRVFPPTSGPWVLMVVVDVAVTAAWFAVLLKLVGKSERFIQTTTATFGYQAVLAPLYVTAGWLIHRFYEDPAWQLPLMLIVIVVVGWSIAVNGHIFRAALEWSTASSVALAILQFVFMQLVSLALFPEQRT